MKIGYICNDCGREISSDEFDHRESIICPECGSYYARNIPKAWCFPDINGQLQGPLCKDDIQNLLDEGQITEQTEILNLDSSERRSFAQWESLQWVKQLPPETSEDPPEKSAPKLTECPQCSSMVSLRATECPKCEAVLKERCLVCSSMIPIGSSLCPQCGDPFPYQVAKTDTIICPNCCKERYTARDLCGHCREPLPDFLRETIPHLLHCIFCNQTLSEQAKECPHCKTSTSQPCQICGKVVSCWSQECPECGDPEPFGNHEGVNHTAESNGSPTETNNHDDDKQEYYSHQGVINPTHGGQISSKRTGGSSSKEKSKPLTSQDQRPEKELGLKWLMFWNYFSLPSGAALGFVISFKNPGIAIIFAPLSIFSIVLAIGLHRREAWAWNFTAGYFVLSWFASVVIGVYTQGLEDSVDVAAAAINFVLTGLLWIYPNYVYWTKRKHLFVN